MRYTLTIQADNDAFGQNEPDRSREVARIMRTVAMRLEHGGTFEALDPLRDINGNRVGQLTLTED